MHDILTPSTDRRCSKPPLIFPCWPGPEIKKRSSNLHRMTYIGAMADPIAWLGSLGIIARVITAITPFVCQIAASTVFESNARAQSVTRSQSIDRFAKFIDEASDRFAVPARWIRAVMQIESGGDDRAISSHGAVGLMQLMPGDPFDPRDNILAGSAYLKEMHDRFGSVGFLAAYHAGPARYEQHLVTGQPLPPETAAYVAAVTSLLGDGQREDAAVRIKRATPWREAPLFVERVDAP